MTQRLFLTAVLVQDYDQAIASRVEGLEPAKRFRMMLFLGSATMTSFEHPRSNPPH